MKSLADSTLTWLAVAAMAMTTHTAAYLAVMTLIAYIVYPEMVAGGIVRIG